jgi:hypothetical protein
LYVSQDTAGKRLGIRKNVFSLSILWKLHWGSENTKRKNHQESRFETDAKLFLFANNWLYVKPLGEASSNYKGKDTRPSAKVPCNSLYREQRVRNVNI